MTFGTSRNTVVIAFAVVLALGGLSCSKKGAPSADSKKTEAQEKTASTQAVTHGTGEKAVSEASGGVSQVDAEITLNQLPKAVQTALQKETPPANIRRIDKLETEGTVTFNVQAVANGMEQVVALAVDGKILGSQTPLEWKSLPSSVQSSLQKQVKSSSISKIEKIYVAETPVTYRVQAMFSGVEKVMVLGDDGSLVSMNPIGE